MEPKVSGSLRTSWIVGESMLHSAATQTCTVSRPHAIRSVSELRRCSSAQSTEESHGFETGDRWPETQHCKSKQVPVRVSSLYQTWLDQRAATAFWPLWASRKRSHLTWHSIRLSDDDLTLMSRQRQRVTYTFRLNNTPSRNSGLETDQPRLVATHLDATGCASFTYWEVNSNLRHDLEQSRYKNSVTL
jgi:hypothetical protein